MTTVKAVSLWQPWASLVALGVKTIETRSWATNYRGPLAIHATAGNVNVGPLGDFKVEDDTPRRSPKQYLLRGDSLAWPYRLPLGAVVATCRLVDCLPMVEPITIAEHLLEETVVQVGCDGRVAVIDRWPSGGEVTRDLTAEVPYGDYSPGRFAWLLADIKPISPVPARGRQQLWNWTGGPEIEP